MRALLATLSEGTLRVYTRDDDGAMDQVGQLRTPTLDHAGALRLMSDLDLLNGWSRNGAVVAVGDGGVRLARAATTALPPTAEEPKPKPKGRRHRIDYAPILKALAVSPGRPMSTRELAALIDVDVNHGGFKTQLHRWVNEGRVQRSQSAGPGHPAVWWVGDVPPPDASSPTGVAQPPGAERRAMILAYVAKHGSITSGEAQRAIPYKDPQSALVHHDLSTLVAKGQLVRAGTPGSAGGKHGGYVWRRP